MEALFHGQTWALLRLQGKPPWKLLILPHPACSHKAPGQSPNPPSHLPGVSESCLHGTVRIRRGLGPNNVVSYAGTARSSQASAAGCPAPQHKPLDFGVIHQLATSLD